MVKKAYLKSLIVLCGIGSYSCNIEIGNPEPPPSSAGFHSLNFSLASYSSCDSTVQDCTSVPVKISDSSDSFYRFDMTSIQMQLKSIQFQPYDSQQVQTIVNLLTGTTVEMGTEQDSTKITNVTVSFADAQIPTYEIQGKFHVVTPTESFNIPITLTDRTALTAQSTVSTGAERISGIVFDANTWFDFSDAKPDMSNVIKNLTSGPCRTADSTQCQNHRDVLAREISKKIAKSLAVRTAPAKGKNK